ncbi:MAG: hypothetical protein AB7K08_03680 [Microbacteriaceae bacterium]
MEKSETTGTESSGHAQQNLAARVRSVVDELGLPSHPAWDEVQARVVARFGKPLHVAALSGEEWASVTGLFLEVEECGYIFYRQSDSPIYQQHSILHEFGHILLEDDDCRILDELPRDLVGDSGVSGAITRAAARGLEVSTTELAAEAIGYALAERLFGSQGRGESAFGL